MPIRAPLSWSVPPPCSNPNYIPIWGNREETLIHIRPGEPEVVGIHTPIIQAVGSMDVDHISPSTGLANGPAALAGFTAEDSPFGGSVIITGHIADTPDISNGAAKLKYRVEVSGDNGASWEFVTNTFALGLDQLLDGVWSDLPSETMAVDGDGFYQYQEDLKNGPGNATFFPVGNVLARWHTGGKTGNWLIRIKVQNSGGVDWLSNAVKVRLDNAQPITNLEITSGGGDCADFSIGEVLSGTYSVSDEHFGHLSLRVLPTEISGNPTGGAFTSPPPLPAGSTMPLVRRYSGGVPTGGEAGTWSLDTTGMAPCGYVLQLSAVDRTIVNSGSKGRWDDDVVGFCLRAKE